MLYSLYDITIFTDWHPFPPSTIGCGPGYLTGVGGSIESPLYPSAYPEEAGCTWIIRVAESQRVLLSFIAMEISTNGQLNNSFYSVFV